jgi:uncharacterized cupin superfamily protein
MVAIHAKDAPLRKKVSNYPEPFASRMRGRAIQPLGDLFGLRNFGVNLATLIPGAVSALRHAHSKQDELVYVLAGQPTLVTDAGDTQLQPGMCTAFPAGTGNAHMIVNRTETDCVYLVVGDRSAGDEAVYPDDDLAASTTADGARCFTHKDGAPYL